MVSDSFAVATLEPWFAWRPVRLGLLGGKRVWWCWVERTKAHGFWLYCEMGTQQRIWGAQNELFDHYDRLWKRDLDNLCRQEDQP